MDPFLFGPAFPGLIFVFMAFSEIFLFVEGEGFEPSKAEPTGLQPVLVDHLSNPP